MQIYGNFKAWEVFTYAEDAKDAPEKCMTSGTHLKLDAKVFFMEKGSLTCQFRGGESNLIEILAKLS